MRYVLIIVTLAALLALVARPACARALRALVVIRRSWWAVLL